MATLQLDNIPDQLVRKLEMAAASQHRDLVTEVISRLDNSFGPVPGGEATHEELSALARQLRGDGKADWLTPEFIREAREHGRE